MPDIEEAPLIWLIAGEPSGDLIGARLIDALNKRTGGRFRVTGIGGEAMESAGLQSRFP
ncbi:MAG: lipid-A-disaccharide synthase, partial [Alphaproteobacteria bacterium]